MSVGSVVARGRRRAAALFTDTCTITAPDPEAEKVWNSATGRYDQAPRTVYSGPCRVKHLGGASRGNASVETVGPEQWLEREPILSLPVDDATAEVGATDQTVTVNTSQNEPALVGCVFGMLGSAPASQATARRFVVKETVG